MHGLTGNLRFALRQLSKAPGFTIAAVLALGFPKNPQAYIHSGENVYLGAAVHVE